MTLLAFNLGMPKSGTTTLQNALVKSGIRSIHWRDGRTGPYLGQSFYRNFRKGAPILTDFPDARIITQADLLVKGMSLWPQMDPTFLDQLQQENPGVRFILTVRDPKKIADSMTRWDNFMGRLRELGAPGMPKGEASEESVACWIEQHYEACRERFPDLIEYDIEDPEAPNILEQRLGIHIKWWGHINKNAVT